jgi:hypothetical protein
VLLIDNKDLFEELGSSQTSTFNPELNLATFQDTLSCLLLQLTMGCKGALQQTQETFADLLTIQWSIIGH